MLVSAFGSLGILLLKRIITDLYKVAGTFYMSVFLKSLVKGLSSGPSWEGAVRVFVYSLHVMCSLTMT